MDIKAAIKKVTSLHHLNEDEMTDVMIQIMSGKATSAQIAAFLIALQMKGESVTEIAAATKVMRQLLTPVVIEEPHLIDIVGTGGDMANTFNISTTCAFIVAAAGGKVAKHGNRSISSRSGSADLLEAAGININLSPEEVISCIAKIGIGFMFAPNYHSAMKFAATTRKEIGVRTLFNLLGPLSNPANAPNLMIGVYAKKLLLPIALVLQKLDCRHALIIHSEDGLDEISIAAATDIVELKAGQINEYQISPQQFGFKVQNLETLCVKSPEESLQLMLKILNNEEGPGRDIVLLNSGAAIYTAGLAASIEHGIELAATALNTGSAHQKLQQLVRLTENFSATKN